MKTTTPPPCAPSSARAPACSRSTRPHADQHTLEVGLKAVAADTGGIYARTHDFPAQAVNRLERALAGYYVLAFEVPASRGTHSLRVRLAGHDGDVLARPTFDN